MDFEEMIIALADIAEIIREARAAHLSPRPVCPSACPETCYVRWGHGRTCCSCGGPVIPAASMHQQLAKALQSAPRPVSARKVQVAA
jgi:hypothetical protein